MTGDFWGPSITAALLNQISMPAVIVSVKRGATTLEIVRANRPFAQLMDSDVSAFGGKRLDDCLPSFADEGELQNINQSVLEQRAWTARGFRRRDDVIVFEKQCSLTPLPSENEDIALMLWLERDVMPFDSLVTLSACGDAVDEVGVVADLLGLINRSADTHELMSNAADFFKRTLSCDAVRIRMRSGDDFPFFETRGVEPELIEKDNSLLKYDWGGRVSGDGAEQALLECICGRVLMGTVGGDEACFTKRGTFWSGNMGAFVDCGHDDDEFVGGLRKICYSAGAESVIVVPLRIAEQTFGLIHLGWCKVGSVNRRLVELVEHIGDQLAVAVSYHLAVDALRDARDHLESRVAARTREITDANLRLAQEIEERQRVELELRENRDLLQAVIDGANDVISVRDCEGRFELVNAVGIKTLNMSLDELRGKHLCDILPAEVAEQLTREDETVISTASPLTSEFSVELENGIRHFHATKVPRLNPSKKVIGVIGIARDITDFRLAQERLAASERLASIGTLAAGIAHEINNPIGGILLAAQNALIETGDSPELRYVKTCLDEIVTDANRCGRIIQSVLRFARHQPTEKWPANVNDIIQHAVGLARQDVATKGMSIHLQLDDSLPTAALNPTEMQQVLMNLVRNAVDHGHQGCRVMLRSFSEDGHVCISVTDDGDGMTAEQKAHVFDPFFTTRQNLGGTGLGLSVVHGIVEAHGGTIEVESQAKHGATFTIKLPLR